MDMDVLSFHLIHADDLTRLVAKRPTFRFFMIECAAKNLAEISLAMAACLPLDPPWHGRNRDSFIDSLFEGLNNLDGQRFCIVFDHIGHLLSRDPGAMEQLSQDIRSVSEDLFTHGKEGKMLHAIFVDDTPRMPPPFEYRE